MTPDKPDAQDLLRTALEAFKEGILPDVPAGKKLEALMILNALGFAERAIEDGGRIAQRQADRLAELDYDSAEALAHDIRAGRFDDEENAKRLFAVLSADVKDRLAQSNPRYLEAAEKEDS